MKRKKVIKKNREKEGERMREREKVMEKERKSRQRKKRKRAEKITMGADPLLLSLLLPLLPPLLPPLLLLVELNDRKKKIHVVKLNFFFLCEFLPF